MIRDNPVAIPFHGCVSKSPEMSRVAFNGRCIFKVEGVILPGTLRAANSIIDNHPSTHNVLSKEQIRLVTLRDDSASIFEYHEVTFDEECKVKEWSDLESDLSHATSELKKLVKEAIEKMAITLNWRDATIKINSRILKYRVT